jgi:hypothetical protein
MTRSPFKQNKKSKINIFSMFIGVGVLLIVFSLIMLQISPRHKSTERKQLVLQGLHVQGNILVNGKGEQVILHGVDHSGTEYECVKNNNQIFEGPNNQALIQAMKSWHINAVRVPLNEDCWLGINGANPSGIAYQKAIINYANLITKNNMYVIVDLHWNAPGTTEATGQQFMADKDHSLAFWTSVAQTFGNNTNIIFDLYNEPHDISWNCWKDGTGCYTPFPIASMQDMINAVRATGANNVLMLGGLSYSNDLSEWLSYEPTDPINNVVASFHMYGKNQCSTTDCWNKTVAPVMAKVPVITGEFGESTDGSICDNNTTLSNNFMQWMDQHNSGYLAWVWNTWGTDCGNLALITNYNGTPKSPNGTNYKNHLERF